MRAGDYGEARSEPWTYRARIVPLRTYSGRVVHHRHKHFFTARDAARILAKLEPAEKDEGSTWAQTVITVLRNATIKMLQRILWFLPPGVVGELYDWGIGILDSLFYQTSNFPEENRQHATRLINYAAGKAGLNVTIGVPK